MLTTLLRIHTTARRHCEAARRQQARVTAGGPSFDDRTRAGAEKFGPNQPPHRLHAPARSPPRHREVPEGGRTGGLHSAAEACGVPHTVQLMRKMQKSVVSCRVEPTPRVLKSCDLSTRPKHFWTTDRLLRNDFERAKTTHVAPRYPGYCEYLEYPPSEGQSHPGRPGPLRAWVGAPRPGPPALWQNIVRQWIAERQ